MSCGGPTSSPAWQKCNIFFQNPITKTALFATSAILAIGAAGALLSGLGVTAYGALGGTSAVFMTAFVIASVQGCTSNLPPTHHVNSKEIKQKNSKTQVRDSDIVRELARDFKIPEDLNERLESTLSPPFKDETDTIPKRLQRFYDTVRDDKEAFITLTLAVIQKSHYTPIDIATVLNELALPASLKEILSMCLGEEIAKHYHGDLSGKAEPYELLITLKSIHEATNGQMPDLFARSISYAIKAVRNRVYNEHGKEVRIKIGLGEGFSCETAMIAPLLPHLKNVGLYKLELSDSGVTSPSDDPSGTEGGFEDVHIKLLLDILKTNPGLTVNICINGMTEKGQARFMHKWQELLNRQDQSHLRCMSRVIEYGTNVEEMDRDIVHYMAKFDPTSANGQLITRIAIRRLKYAYHGIPRKDTESSLQSLFSEAKDNPPVFITLFNLAAQYSPELLES